MWARPRKPVPHRVGSPRFPPEGWEPNWRGGQPFGRDSVVQDSGTSRAWQGDQMQHAGTTRTHRGGAPCQNFS